MNTQILDAVDLKSYFQRIGYSGDLAPTLDTLQAIHRQHAETIAFENLNSLVGEPVHLNLAALQQKLIQEERGGYCFEQNWLLRSVLTSLGFEVTNLAARVLWNLPEATITPRNHMLLQVQIQEKQYIADVGFGGLTLTAPLSLTPDIEQHTPHEPFRLLFVDHAYVMQALIGQAWKSLYQFDLQKQYLPDYEVSNWYVSTYPNSLFVTNLIVAKPDANCRYALQNNQLTVHYLDGRTEQRLLSTVAELRAVLEEIFGIKLDKLVNLDAALQKVVALT